MINKTLALTIVNVLLFQVGWLICILLGSFWAGVFTLFALVLHFSVYSQRLNDAVAIVVAVLIGLLHESILLYAGIIVFVESIYFPPLWLMCLWVLLGITLNHSLVWIYSRPRWAALLGALAAPFSYLAGVNLSSAEWSSPLIQVVPIIVVLWLVVLPLHRLISLRVVAYVQHKTKQSSARDCDR